MVKIFVDYSILSCESLRVKQTNQNQTANPQGSRTIPMNEFFALPEVVAAQEIQKRNPFGSVAHRQAYEIICRIAGKYGVGQFINRLNY